MCIKAAKLDQDAEFADKPFSHPIIACVGSASQMSSPSKWRLTSCRQETRKPLTRLWLHLVNASAACLSSQSAVLHSNMHMDHDTLQPKKMLNLSGADLVILSTLCGTNHRVTGSITVSAAGDILKLMVIFNGWPAGHVAQCKLPILQQNWNCILMCQDNAWMDEVDPADPSTIPTAEKGWSGPCSDSWQLQGSWTKLKEDSPEKLV